VPLGRTRSERFGSGGGTLAGGLRADAEDELISPQLLPRPLQGGNCQAAAMEIDWVLGPRLCWR